MSYRVRIDAYQGPFDLLLTLVSRQKIDIGAISIADITDQYLAEVERMKDLDLDIASDFLVVAATLLQIKASSLLPKDGIEQIELDDEFADLTPEQTRDILVERLVVYKQFKNAAAALGMRMENEAKMHPRQASLEEQFLGLMPDYLKGTTLHGLAVICADIAARRDTFLLEAEHIAAVPISMEKHVEGIYRSMRRRESCTFSQLVGDTPTPELVVVTFLAILELYKRGVIRICQDAAFAEIQLDIDADAPEITDFSVPDWGMPEDPSLEQLDDEDVQDAPNEDMQDEE
ncbi:MAG TPA: segregation/condensation protein A [Coriobacteriaceae bacterium]|nr:segregation/condensation protein A [Coriobacteriaceae bacterium]